MYQLTLDGGYEKVKVKRKRSTATRKGETVATFVHLGAGRQSSTIVEMIIAGELPRPTAVLFADTGDEPYWVYRQVWNLAERLNTVGIPLLIFDDGTGKTLLEQIKDPKWKFVSLPLFTVNPKTGKVGRMKRQCTGNRKIDTCTDEVLSWLLAHGYAKIIIDKNGRKTRRVNPGVVVADWYGISTDEIERAGKRGAAWRKTVYPLIDKRMGVVDCIKWLQVRKLPVPRKSSCWYCPFHSDEHWLDMLENEPEIFEEACQFDEWLRSLEAKAKYKSLRQDVYLHWSCKPLRSVDFKALVIMKSSKPAAASELCGDFCMT